MILNNNTLLWGFNFLFGVTILSYYLTITILDKTLIWWPFSYLGVRACWGWAKPHHTSPSSSPIIYSCLIYHV